MCLPLGQGSALGARPYGGKQQNNDTFLALPRLGMLSLIDEFTRECLVIEVARKFKGQDVVAIYIGKLRDECLNEHWFLSLDDAREKIESWREDYNHRRPRSSTELGTQIRDTSGSCDV